MNTGNMANDSLSVLEFSRNLLYEDIPPSSSDEDSFWSFPTTVARSSSSTSRPKVRFGSFWPFVDKKTKSKGESEPEQQSNFTEPWDTQKHLPTTHRRIFTDGFLATSSNRGLLCSILPEIEVYRRDVLVNRDWSLVFSDSVSEKIRMYGRFSCKLDSSDGPVTRPAVLRAEAKRTRKQNSPPPQLRPVRNIDDGQMSFQPSTSNMTDARDAILRFPECIVRNDDLCWEVDHKSSQLLLRMKPRLGRLVMEAADMVVDINVAELHIRSFLQQSDKQNHEILSNQLNIDIVTNHLKNDRRFFVRYMFVDSEERWEERKHERSEDEYDKIRKEDNRLTNADFRSRYLVKRGHFNKGLELPTKAYFYQVKGEHRSVKALCELCGKLSQEPKMKRFDHISVTGRVKQRISNSLESMRLDTSGCRSKCNELLHKDPEFTDRLRKEGVFVKTPQRTSSNVFQSTSGALFNGLSWMVKMENEDESEDRLNCKEPVLWNTENTATPPQGWICQEATPCPVCTKEKRFMYPGRTCTVPAEEYGDRYTPPPNVKPESSECAPEAGSTPKTGSGGKDLTLKIGKAQGKDTSLLPNEKDTSCNKPQEASWKLKSKEKAEHKEMSPSPTKTETSSSSDKPRKASWTSWKSKSSKEKDKVQEQTDLHSHESTKDIETTLGDDPNDPIELWSDVRLGKRPVR